ncbi:TraB/GumN family protein [Anaerosphaera multitolerans]|uniref:TraB/GumN family protein n=1 Tax=Anaerosphaera multitolerans TaxID=2487351 RepID=A0A437S602_9FIRM|nr:TraB/GumN family protein [Anaerosphaera multitolerans]RVU54336.1 TraB/GumN family protein [Anaerosphaera multitolerans]
MKLRNKFKKLPVLMALVFFLNINVIFAQEELQAPIVSDWSVLALDNAQKKGILPLSTSPIDYRENIKTEELKNLNDNTLEKLQSFSLQPSKEFKPLELKNNLTREDVLINIFNIIGTYDEEIGESTDPIKFLQEKNILVGNGENLQLDRAASYEESATFYNRAVDYLAYKNNLGSKGYFYKAENKGNIVYMLGSIHLGSNDMYPLKKEIVDAFYNSDELYVEVDISNEESSYMADLMPRTDGTTLKDDLGEEVYSKLKKYMDNYEIPEENYNNLKLWAAYNQISNIPIFVNQPLGTSLGIDSHFISHAKLLGKPVKELESIKLQADTLASYDENEYKKMLIDLIEDLDENGEKNHIDSLNYMYKAWIDGNEEYMKLSSDPNNPFSQLLLKDRDPKMADQIEEMLNSEEGKTYFVVVGSLHYVPDNSVLKYLEDKGFEIVNLNN